jgi:hypothetical protein
VRVRYGFAGVSSPVDGGGVVNVVKAGRGVPTKFSLTGNMGLGVFAAGSPASQRISCDSDATRDVLEETVTAGQSNMAYDASADQYNYVWKTDSAWTGTCRRLTLTFNDGAAHSALFRFAK